MLRRIDLILPDGTSIGNAVWDDRFGLPSGWDDLAAHADTATLFTFEFGGRKHLDVSVRNTSIPAPDDAQERVGRDGVTKPLEKAARALCVARGIDPEAAASGMDPWAKEWTKHAGDARAVLEAIREPSEGMRDSGGFICSPVSNNPVRWSVLNKRERKFSEKYATDVWQAMIDAALSEPLPGESSATPTEEIRP